jgi:hypothetical protein
MIKTYVSYLFWSMLAMVWVPTLAFAGVVAVTPAGEVLNVPAVIVVVNLILSTLAGVTTLAIRINAQLFAAPESKLPRPLLFCTAHMMGSWLAGTSVFLLSQHLQVGIWMGFMQVLLASFGGAKVLEMLAEKYLPMRPSALTGESP